MYYDHSKVMEAQRLLKVPNKGICMVCWEQGLNQLKIKHKEDCSFKIRIDKEIYKTRIAAQKSANTIGVSMTVFYIDYGNGVDYTTYSPEDEREIEFIEKISPK